MKYLHDDRLAELTRALTDCPVGGAVSQRVLHGRLETYTMKRGSDDKKYAFKLGEKFVASLENLAEDVSMIQKVSRKRSQSAGVFEDATVPEPVPKRRSRSSSFDATRSRLRDSDPLANLLPPMYEGVVPSALGDFAEQGTRRLMVRRCLLCSCFYDLRAVDSNVSSVNAQSLVLLFSYKTDLILTLNMSFPDFDFGAVRPTDFAHPSVKSAVDRINRCLSDVALYRESFLTELWSSMDSVIHLSDCDVYSYQPNDGDAFFLTQTLTEDSMLLGNDNTMGHCSTPDKTTGDSSLQSQQPPTTIWSFNYFFVNKTAKRILFFTCVESMRSPSDEEEEDDDDFGTLPSMVVESVEDSMESDFDLDPAAAPAGGIPVLTV
jgi:hypothetical protein